MDVGTIPATSSSAKGLLVIDKLHPFYLETGGERSEMQADKGVVFPIDHWAVFHPKRFYM